MVPLISIQNLIINQLLVARRRPSITEALWQLNPIVNFKPPGISASAETPITPYLLSYQHRTVVSKLILEKSGVAIVGDWARQYLTTICFIFFFSSCFMSTY